MCGRFQVAWPWRKLLKRFGVEHGKPVPPGFQLPAKFEECIPRFNVCPTYRVPVVLELDGDRHMLPMRWGFPALWLERTGKDPWSRQLFNAQGADAHKKPTWREALAQRRCLIPATGFYEWFRVDKQRFPLLLRAQDRELMAFAGVWGAFDKDGETVHRFSIITAGPGAELAPLHNRGPVIVDEADWDLWLSGERRAARELIRDVPDGLLSMTEVNTALGDIKNTGQQLMEPDWALPT